MSVINNNRISDLLKNLPVANEMAVQIDRDSPKPGKRNAAVTGGIPDDAFVKMIAPPADARLKDKRFERIRGQLIEWYGPTEPTELVDIDLIVSDLLLLADLRQAMELITTPAISPENAKAARRSVKHHKLANLLKRLIRRDEASQPFDCSDKEALILARKLAQTFDWLRQLVAEADAEAATANGNSVGKPEDDFDPDPDDARRRELLKIITPIKSVLEDVQQTKRVLSGGHEPAPADRVRWTTILRLTLENAIAGNYGTEKAIAASMTAEREVLVTLAQDPVKLALLHRTASQFEEAIAKRIRRLKNSL